MVIDEVYAANMSWKHQSLQFLLGGRLLHAKPVISVDTPEGVLQFEMVNTLKAFGCALDGKSSSLTSVFHALQRGATVY